MRTKRKEVEKERRTKAKIDRPLPKTNSGKRKKRESNDDFEIPLKKLNEPMQIPQKKFVEFRNTKLKLRCSPSSFITSIKTFTDAQVSAVKNMGFGPILTMNIDNIPTGLGYWLLVNYDEETNVLNMGNHKVKITASKVHEIFGIPMGKIKVLEKNKPRKGTHSTIDEFKNQFEITRISVGKVLPIMEQHQDGGRMFKLNFLVIWNTLYAEITKSTTINQRFLLGIDDESEIPDMDWCSYMIECLKRTKESWKGDDDQYNGPIVLLAVLYTHEYEKRHKPLRDPIRTPAISYITSETLCDMESFLFDNGPLTDDEIEETNIQAENDNRMMNLDNIDDEYTLPPVSTPRARILFDYEQENEKTSAAMEKLDKVIQAGSDNDTHDNLEDDYARYEHSPLNTDLLMNIGTSTQRFINDFITQPQLTRMPAYVDHDQHEASKKVMKVWINSMDKKIKKFNKIVAEMGEMVKEAKSKYSWDEEIMERCHLWENELCMIQKS